MRQYLLLAAALFPVISSASALAPDKRYMKRESTAGLTRSLLKHSSRYLSEVKTEWKNQPVRVSGGFKRYGPLTVLGTSATVESADSDTASHYGYLTIKVRFRETALCATAQQALSAPFRGRREISFEPMFAYRQGKWIPASEE